MNLILGERVESLVDMILKRSKIGWCDHAGLLGGSGQSLILDGKFSASIEALLIFWKRFNCVGLVNSEFLPTRLLSEILLSHRHNRHFGIAVHHHQISSIAREKHIFCAPLSSLPCLRHFV